MLVDPTQEAYQRSMAELESQGEGPRKRARYLRWVPAWGDMKWDSTQRAQGVEYTPPDVLASARGMWFLFSPFFREVQHSGS